MSADDGEWDFNDGVSIGGNTMDSQGWAELPGVDAAARVPSSSSAGAAAVASAGHGHDTGGPKVSDAITYGPRFCQLFQEFSSTLSVPINTDRHLMALCAEYLVAFCKWARESEAQIASIRATLLDNDYLRPEVRNGIVVVLIYTFSAMKVRTSPGAHVDPPTTPHPFHLARVGAFTGTKRP